MALRRGTEARRRLIAPAAVLGSAPLYAGPPFAPVSGVHLAAHHFDHFGLAQAELRLDGIKRGSILPGHFNNPIEIAISQLIFFVNFHRLLNQISGYRVYFCC